MSNTTPQMFGVMPRQMPWIAFQAECWLVGEAVPNLRLVWRRLRSDACFASTPIWCQATPTHRDANSGRLSWLPVVEVTVQWVMTEINELARWDCCGGQGNLCIVCTLLAVAKVVETFRITAQLIINFVQALAPSISASPCTQKVWIVVQMESLQVPQYLLQGGQQTALTLQNYTNAFKE